MKVILNEEQLNFYKIYLLENNEDEGRAVPKAVRDVVSKEAEDVARFLYGDEYGKKNEFLSQKYGVEVTKDANIATGLFSLGNAKLSDDTLIINFTSALRCPSLALCPITQKACYAVAGENRLSDVRRKNLKVDEFWRAARDKYRAGFADAIERVFGIARKYIEGLNAKKPNGEYKYKKPIRFIRFNEAGDFFCQVILDSAARFAAFAKEYGIMSMAYTANKNLDFKKIPDGLDKPIDNYIKINASREDIELSDNVTKQRFFATPMDFKEMLAQNDKVEQISDGAAYKLQCKGTIKGENGILSVPRLTYGEWQGGEGWYYVCPCSFWKYNKDKAESLFYQKLGMVSADVSLDDSLRMDLRKRLNKEQKAQLKSILNKVKSPCGVECAVCHDMEGGITPDGKRIKNYAVLTATHGSTKGNYDPIYAFLKRTGRDVEAIHNNNKDNPLGIERKYDKNVKDFYRSQQSLKNKGDNNVTDNN